MLLEPVERQGDRSAIVRPDAFKEEKVHAVVLATGPGRLTRRGVRVPCVVQPGDILFIGKNPVDAQDVLYGKKKFILVPEHRLLARLSA